MKTDFLDSPNLIEEAQKINQIAMDPNRTTTGAASWTNPRTSASYSVASGGELALAKKIRDDNESVFGVLDLDTAIGALETGKQPRTSGGTRPSTPLAGQMHFDTALTPPRPIWYTGAAWVDATGTSV